MDLEQMAREMGKQIQASEEYRALQAAKAANDADETLQQAIGDFNLKRIALSNAASDENSDKSKIKKLDQELKAVYQNIMQNPNMVAFQHAKEQMDHMMSQVTNILMMCVNGEDPDTCQPASCSGSCSSCDGCH